MKFTVLVSVLEEPLRVTLKVKVFVPASPSTSLTSPMLNVLRSFVPIVAVPLIPVPTFAFVVVASTFTLKASSSSSVESFVVETRICPVVCPAGIVSVCSEVVSVKSPDVALPVSVTQRTSTGFADGELKVTVNTAS